MEKRFNLYLHFFTDWEPRPALKEQHVCAVHLKLIQRKKVLNENCNQKLTLKKIKKQNKTATFLSNQNTQSQEVDWVMIEILPGAL